MACFRKLTGKYSQTFVDWRKGSQFIYPQPFVVIGMVDADDLILSMFAAGVQNV